MIIRISAAILFVAILSGCGSDSPTTPTGACDDAVVTIGMFSNGSPASPGQGLVWKSYFEATVLPAEPTVYAVDIKFASPECRTTWTAVSSDTSAVQLSPASGSGRSLVELFMPANFGAQRSTLVTIAGQTASITQRGR